MNPEEILDIEPVQEPTELSDLSWIGRAIVANNVRAATIEDFRDKEIEKIKACCDQKIERLGEDSAHLEGMASVVMKSHDYSYENKNLRKYDMPGIGAFRFSVTRESVDTSEYEGLGVDGVKKVIAAQPNFFNVRTTTTPDKAEIAKELKKGGWVEGFKLKPKFEKFEFKSE